MSMRDRPRPEPTRRRLISLGALAIGWSVLERVPVHANSFLVAGPPSTSTPASKPASTPIDGRDLEKVLERAARLGLRAFRVVEADRYVAVGQADDDYMDASVSICNTLAEDYLEHFNELGFEVRLPESPLVLVVLSDAEAFSRYLDEPADVQVGGVYDLEGNQLVIFDFRGEEGLLERAEAINTLTLMHEAMHQLTFNSGLLDRGGDVPLAISEGLAMYAETRRAYGPARGRRFGQVNRGRLEALRLGFREGLTWIPLKDLIADDSLLVQERTVQLAYAESWLLVDYLIGRRASRTRRRSFRSYLERIREVRLGDKERRQSDARAALGDLGRLDRAVQQHARRLLG